MLDLVHRCSASFPYWLYPAVRTHLYTRVPTEVILTACRWRHFSSTKPSASPKPSTALHVTVIRPVKGLEPRLYDCLASTFRQDYPKDHLHIRFCISDRSDPSLPVIQRLLDDFPGVDAQLLVENEDEALNDGKDALGPNPKIRNMSRAYRTAIGDVIWIIDCNVWVARGVCGRMVAKLEGHGTPHRNKFVHQLPLVVDVLESGPSAGDSQELLPGGTQLRTTSSASATLQGTSERTPLSIGGGRLEELFMSTAHAKFYTAINTVLIAPCSVGKSTMFRRSHLDHVTSEKNEGSVGLDFFSQNICEDHLIGDLLWKNSVPEELAGERMGKHACLFGDLAIQPMANMSLSEYWRRRVRWLRVRKFTVTLATLVEPGTESFLCSAYGAWAATTLPVLGLPQTWTAFGVLWLLSVMIWCALDRTLYLKLHSGASISHDGETPFFARASTAGCRRPFGEWLFAWIGRETLAFPIWFWAIYGGATVEWRGKRFWVGMDMKVHEMVTTKAEGGSERGSSTPADRKARRD